MLSFVSRPVTTKYADTNAQPAPKPTGESISITNAVIADLEFRREHGIKKYGVELVSHNGRDALTDAYQEALDLVIYLRQALAERDSTASVPPVAGMACS